MGAGPVSGAAVSSTPGWRLAGPCAAQTQGLVVSPFAHLEAGAALFLHWPAGAGGAWLAALRAQIPITDAAGETAPCAAIAFTFSGLAELGLGGQALASFSDPFREGMLQVHRRRRLGDEGPTMAPGGALWSGNAHGEGAATPTTVHALLLLYAADDATLDARVATAQAVLAAHGVAIAYRKRLSLRVDAQGIAREHFGFADGISQPLPHGDQIVRSDGSPAPVDPWHAVAAGDILFGHTNAHGEPAPGPTLGAGEGSPDLALNGSYLVVRELRQDVAAFWRSMDGAAAALAEPGHDADWLAARVVGRTRDGAALSPVPGGAGTPGQPPNAFGFLGADPHGFGCPLGSHIRRANPRDGLARDAKLGPELLHAANNHRILRRGRKFGPDIADPRSDDGAERGLLFMCLNTDLVRQFEFVQQTWLGNPSFQTLLDETDPLVGPAGPFTVQGEPLRRRVAVETFVTFAGGEYFFLPSLPALDYLQTVKGG